MTLRFICGWKGPVNFCCVMKGCVRACCGDHRSSGLMLSSPCTKSMNASRFAISVLVSFQFFFQSRFTYLAQSRSASSPSSALGSCG